jgi:hypothetical protein
MSRIKLEANVSTESFPKAPTFEATFSQTDGPDLTLAMTLRGMSDLFGAMLMQGVNDLPIHQEDVQKLSLQFVCLRNDFEFEVKQIIASTIYTVINKYFSPRVVLKLFDDLDKDWAATVARRRNDRFAQFAIETIEAEVAKSNMSTKTVIDGHRAALREVIGRGNPGDPACSVFFEGIVALACKQGSNLVLPPREVRPGRPRNTPLYVFACGMCELLCRCGNWVLDQRSLARGRFDKFDVRRGRLIKRLEVARETILQEISMSPFNSPEPGN